MKKVNKVVSAVALVLSFLVWGAQASGVSLEKGMMLVASEEIADPRFRDRVVLLIQHDIHGSAGLVVNRTSRLSLSSVLEAESSLAGSDAMLSYGGPVEPETLLALVRIRQHPPEPSDNIHENLYVTGLSILENWEDYEAEVISFRPFVGYTGWAPGQLIDEMSRGGWRAVSADLDGVFVAQNEEYWQELNRRLPSLE